MDAHGMSLRENKDGVEGGVPDGILSTVGECRRMPPGPRSKPIPIIFFGRDPVG